ncbi:MAG: 50S ribosomal protein L10 [Desulfarculales bacterium]|nr:50S ribosomal protein L10 [Desulfarculales bacterium]
MNKEEKKAVIQDMAERLDRAQALFLTDFSGLSVESMTELRSQITEKGHEYVVVKNTLLKRAGKGKPAEILADRLAGPNGLGISYGDPVDLAKLLVEFAKTNNKLEIRGGLLSGKLMDVAGVASLSKLPSREVLLAILLGALNGVPRNLVSVLAAVPRGLLNVLKAIEEQKAGN